MTPKHTIYTLGLFLIANIAVGQQVFKSIDESGNVTYSSTPPQNAVKAKPVEIEPGPTEERVRAAQQRAEEMKQQAQSIERSQKPAQPEAADSSESPEDVEQIDRLGVTGYDRRPDPRTRVPIESPTEGDHPIYTNPRPPTIQPVPRPRPAAR